MTIEVVQQLTVLAPNSPGLRTDVIDDILARLTRSNRVDLVETSTGDRYFLTDLGRQHTDEAAESAAHLFRPVLDRMLRDTAGVFSPDVGEVVAARSYPSASRASDIKSPRRLPEISKTTVHSAEPTSMGHSTPLSRTFLSQEKRFVLSVPDAIAFSAAWSPTTRTSGFASRRATTSSSSSS